MATTRAHAIALLKLAVDGADFDAVFELRKLPGLDRDVSDRARQAAYRIKNDGLTSPLSKEEVRQSVLKAAQAMGADAIQIAEELVEALSGKPEPTSGIRKGTYTVKLDEDRALTLRVRRQSMTADFAPGEWVIKKLKGANNETDYLNVGFVNRNPQGKGFVVLFKRHRQDENLVKAVRALQDGPEAAGALWARETKHCFRCGRHVSNEQSLTDFETDGLGPICRQKVAAGR